MTDPTARTPLTDESNDLIDWFATSQRLSRGGKHALELRRRLGIVERAARAVPACPYCGTALAQPAPAAPSQPDLREALREHVRQYRKTANTLAGIAPEAGYIDTLEGRMTYEAGDYICGPGADGEFWPVRKDIFEATYAPAAAARAPSQPDLREALYRQVGRLNAPDGKVDVAEVFEVIDNLTLPWLASQPAPAVEPEDDR